MVPGCLRIRAAQHIDVNQSVHAVPLPCPLAASAIINTGTPRPTPQVRANASYFDVVPSAEDVQSPLAEPVPIKEIDAVAKASGKSTPYVLGRKYSKHVIGVVSELAAVDIPSSVCVASPHLWFFAVDDPYRDCLTYSRTQTGGNAANSLFCLIICIRSLAALCVRRIAMR